MTVNGDGTYDSVTVTATEAGNYQWHASYSGDSNNSPASDQGGEARREWRRPRRVLDKVMAATVGGTIQFSLTSPDGSTVSMGLP